MKKLYSPPVLGDEKRSISGGYTPLEKILIQYKNRQLLIILGTACLDGSCCGSSNWNYIQVAGYLLTSSEKAAAGTANALEIDTIDNESDQEAIRQILMQKYPNSRIEFD